MNVFFSIMEAKWFAAYYKHVSVDNGLNFADHDVPLLILIYYKKDEHAYIHPLHGA